MFGLTVAMASPSHELKKVQQQGQALLQAEAQVQQMNSETVGGSLSSLVSDSTSVASGASVLLRRHSLDSGLEAALTEDSSTKGIVDVAFKSFGNLRRRKPWLIAVCTSVLSSFLCVCGFMLQKIGVSRLSNRTTYYTIGSIVLSPCWIAGLLLLIFANVFGDYEAYSLAPLSLTAPLSGVTVVLNLILVPICLGEKVQIFPDLFATSLIFIGAALTTAYGAHQDETLSSRDIATLVMRPANIALYLVLLFWLAILWKCDEWRSEASVGKAFTTPPPRMSQVVVIASTAAIAGCLMNLHLKATAELIKSGSSWSGVVLSLLCCAPYAALQMNFISRGLRLYMQTLFVPVYNSLLMVSVTFCGGIFYGEGALIDRKARWYFTVGLLLCLSGLWQLTLRSSHGDGGAEKQLTMFARRSQATAAHRQKKEMT